MPIALKDLVDLVSLAGFLTVEGFTVRRNPPESPKRHLSIQETGGRGRLSDRMDELDAITAVVQMYVDGAAQADVGRMKEAFHESARLFGNEGDERYDMPISEFFEYVATTPIPGPGFRSRIMSIDVVEDAAVAVLAEDDYHGVDYVDFFSLIKLDGTWKIVIKLFAVTGQTPTDEA